MEVLPNSSRQFTLRRALASFGSMTFGVALMSSVYRIFGSKADTSLLQLLLLWFGGGALIGAGLFHLLSRWWWIGALASVPILYLHLLGLGLSLGVH